ncbi:MAG: hypothetical protein AAGF95_14390 [Chloroflexota bacterium]
MKYIFTRQRAIRTHHQGVYWSVFMVLLLALLVACSNYSLTGPREVDKVVIIPDHYEGFLVVRYDCPDGMPLPDTGDIITYFFRQDGTICTSDTVQRMHSQYAVRTHSGTQLIAMGQPWPEVGYGLARPSIRTTSITGQRMSLGIYWVGNLDERDRMSDYDQRLDQFLIERFGTP